ncbi:uncharacterized protein LOC136078667 [Hydra vulgaris]|uniref:Uncharacterized protein LOC136078667 n=1 Tax=Hydra vulgaris TaxID=6087 RepID=A0ABM4BN57_HYDVU
MEFDYECLEEQNWPTIPSASAEVTKNMHKWCGKISYIVSDLLKQLKILEDEKLNVSIATSNKPTTIFTYAQATSIQQNQSKPKETELVMMTKITNEFNNKKRIENNIIISGVADHAIKKSAIIHDIVYNHSLDIFILTETWIKSDDPPAIQEDMAPTGFKTIQYCRSDHRGGGVAIVYRDNLYIKPISLLSTCLSYERTSAKLNLANNIYNIIAIYRSNPIIPTNIFFLELSVLCGDFNCPGTTPTTCNPRLAEILETYNMIQRVQSPTRISSTTSIANLLDLVINRHDDISLNNIQVTDEGISDHYMIRVALYHQPSNSKTVWFSKRNFRKLNLSCFIKELQVMLCCLSPENNVDDYAEQVRANITTVLDHLAPIQKYSMRPGKHDDKWLFSDAKNKKIRRRKLEPYGNQKETWNIAKKLLHSISSKTKNTIPEAKCNIISQYFINKLESIKNTIQERLAKNPKSKFISELHPPVNILATFGTVTPTDVSKIIKALKPKTSPLDIIPTYILKSCSELFSLIIAHLANLSFKSGVFPASYKVAQITPTPKKSGLAEFDLSNLRPISNLNTISKILEKLALSRLLPHVTSSINFNPLQSGFRSNHSTETALLKICNDILLNIDDALNTILLSLDISSAFDTIDHSLLISRIKDEFGATDIALKWLTSYLHS